MVSPNTPQHDFTAGAGDYERRIRTLVPGYDTLHELSAAVLRAQLPDAARVLCVGAGTGEEIARLATAGPQWRFVGADPSADMLAQARARLQQAGVLDRVALVAGHAQTLPASSPYDAGTLILVLHFLKDDAARAALLGAIAERLKPGAPLLLASLYREGNAAAVLDAWKALQVLGGLPHAAVEERMAPRLAEARPVADDELAGLLADAGFGPPTRYFQGLMMAAWVAWRR
ncbi:MAG: class I SAM-dependent methyltransferase [Immundisolibacter sp.]|uniref:class I SAM-dependent methyltransferase n=1 Tax=Immundisolibacter sp. TaxID=1934948 RepID=UPI003D0997B2